MGYLVFYQFTRDCVIFSFWLSFLAVHLLVFLREKVQFSLRVVLAMFSSFLETEWFHFFQTSANALLWSPAGLI